MEFFGGRIDFGAGAFFCTRRAVVFVRLWRKIIKVILQEKKVFHALVNYHITESQTFFGG